jgi:hypothetical protein
VETLTAFLTSCPALRRVVYRPQRNANGTKSIYLTSCVPVWRRPHCPTRPGTGKAAEPGPTNVVRPRASRSGHPRGALLPFCFDSRLTAQPAACVGHLDDDLGLVATPEQPEQDHDAGPLRPTVDVYDAGSSCSLAIRATASGVNPNFDCRALRGADAPNVDIATTAPVDPT